MEGVALPLRQERDSHGPLKVFGLRYRSFVPGWGLHPALGAQSPVQLLLRHPGRPSDYVVTLHEWRIDGEAYAGPPADLADASQRRADRIIVDVMPRDPAIAPRSEPARGLGPFCLDLRALCC